MFDSWKLKFKSLFEFRHSMLIVLFFSLFLLVSCASPQPDPPQIEQPVATAEVSESGPLYIYGEQTVAQKELALNLDDAPFLLNNSYIGLAGVVWGRQKIALVNVGGRGLVLVEGDFWQEYRVDQITRKSLILKKQEDKNEDKD